MRPPKTFRNPERLCISVKSPGKMLHVPGKLIGVFQLGNWKILDTSSEISSWGHV